MSVLVIFAWPSHRFKSSFPTACSAEFPSSPLYDEVEVAFTSLPGGPTKELLIYGLPYCIQMRFPQPPPGLKERPEEDPEDWTLSYYELHQDTSGFLSAFSDSDWWPINHLEKSIDH